MDNYDYLEPMQLKAEFVNVAPEGKDIVKVPAAGSTQRASKQNLQSASPNKLMEEANGRTTPSPFAKSQRIRSRAVRNSSSFVATTESEDVEFSEYIHEERISTESTVVVIADSEDEENTPEADNKKRPLDDESAEPLRKKQEFEGDVEKQPEQVANSDSTAFTSTQQEPSQQEPPQTPAKHQVDIFYTPATSFKQENSNSINKNQQISTGSGAGRRIKVREPSMSPVAAVKKKSVLAKSPDSPVNIKTEDSNSSDAVATSDSEEVETELSTTKNEPVVEIKQESVVQNNDDPEAASVIGQVLEGVLLTLVVISLAFTARWFAAEQFKVGYCGVTESPRIIQQWYYNPPQVWQDYVTKDYILGRTQQFIDEIRPTCIECPEHAICSDGFHSECEPGYFKVESILSVGGYLPVPPYCKLDTSREDRYRKLKQKALEILRERNGRAVCGTDIDSKIGISELRRVLFDGQKPSLRDRAGSGENQENSDSGAITPRAVFVQSTSESKLTAACQVHRAVAAGLARYGFQLKCLLVFVMLFRVLYTVLTARARRHARLERFADHVVERLRQQIFEAEDDLRGLTMRGVEVSRAKREFFERFNVPLPAAGEAVTVDKESVSLRNDLEAVWKMVAKLVENSDLVEVKQAIIYGEIMRVWEYVGSTSH